MKKRLSAECEEVMDYIYNAEEESSLQFYTQAKIWLHLFFCPECAREQRNLQHIKEIMGADFFPLSPEFEDIIMEELQKEAAFEEKADAPAGFSFRGWVIIGFFLLFSLSSAFFGMNFIQIADSEGPSFLLPVGLTIGMFLTCYGAFFIGSHLKELSARFRLR